MSNIESVSQYGGTGAYNIPEVVSNPDLEDYTDEELLIALLSRNHIDEAPVVRKWATQAIEVIVGFGSDNVFYVSAPLDSLNVLVEKS